MMRLLPDPPWLDGPEECAVCPRCGDAHSPGHSGALVCDWCEATERADYDYTDRFHVERES